MDGKGCLVGVEEWQFGVDAELEEEGDDCAGLGHEQT